MARRSARKTVEHALEIGIGLAVIGGVIAYAGFERSTEESTRIALLAGGLGFGLWLTRPLLDWLIDRTNKQVRATERWWKQRRNGVLLALSLAALAVALAYYAAALPIERSALIGAGVGLAALVFWEILPFFRWIGSLLGRFWRWIMKRRKGPTLFLRPKSSTPAARPIKRGQLDRLSPAAFEELCTAIAQAWGYRAQRSGKSGDGGIDVEMWRDGDYVVAQCKHYPGRSVPIGHVRDFYGAMVHVNAARGYFFTTGQFTDGAYTFIEGKPIELVDGAYIERILARLNRGERIARPTPTRLPSR